MKKCNETYNFSEGEWINMRKDFGAKPTVYPMPVLMIATYSEDGTPDVMNAAWGMITDASEITISLSEHKTTENLRKKGEIGRASCRERV